MTAESTGPRPRAARCVHCGQPVSLDPSNPWRPFCSERCKLLDLGRWFEGQYAVPAAEDDGADDQTRE